MQIEPTLLCSLECVMCPWTEIRQQGGTMTWETFERIAEYLPQATAVDFTGGGEPLKNPRLLDMVKVAKQAGCEVGFSTNGVLLTPPVAEKLVELGLDWISFSVDAASAITYERIRQGSSFETIITNIRALQTIKQHHAVSHPTMMMVYVLMTGSHQNYPEFPAFIELAHSLGVEQVIAKNLDVILKSSDDERRLFQHDGVIPEEINNCLDTAAKRAAELGIALRTYNLQPRELPICEHNPLHNLYFNWAGYVSPCISLSYAEQRIFAGEQVLVPCQLYGNINQENLPSIWNKAEYVQFRQQFSQRLRYQQHALMDAFLGSPNGSPAEMPLAPIGCQTCYYLYGI